MMLRGRLEVDSHCMWSLKVGHLAMHLVGYHLDDNEESLSLYIREGDRLLHRCK
jgi:hypothetical protein